MPTKTQKFVSYECTALDRLRGATEAIEKGARGKDSKAPDAGPLAVTRSLLVELVGRTILRATLYAGRSGKPARLAIELAADVLGPAQTIIVEPDMSSLRDEVERGRTMWGRTSASVKLTQGAVPGGQKRVVRAMTGQTIDKAELYEADHQNGAVMLWFAGTTLTSVVIEPTELAKDGIEIDAKHGDADASGIPRGLHVSWRD